MLAPGAVWLVITAPVWAAVLAPTALGFFLVLFSAYLLFKSLSFGVSLVVVYSRLGPAQARDWSVEVSVLPGYDLLRHLVIVPAYGESVEILADTLHHLAVQHVD